MKPCRLIYRSVAKPLLLNDSALSILNNRAANVNRRYGVTGMLLLSGDRFLQVLEGSTKFVNTIYSKIIRDTQHFDVELVSFESIVRTEFQDWSMKLFKLEDVEGPMHDHLVKKYPVVDGKIQFVDDPVLMTSLLLDIKHLNINSYSGKYTHASL